MNNALNGAVVNLEVVKARARPGRDAEAVASFAAAASEQVEETAALVGALLALARPPRAPLDVAQALRQTVTLLAPSAARLGITLDVAGATACVAGGDAIAARLVVVAALLSAVDASAARATAESADLDSGHDPSGVIRCSTRLDPEPMLELTPGDCASLPGALVRALDLAGIACRADRGALCLAFPAPAAPL